MQTPLLARSRKGLMESGQPHSFPSALGLTQLQPVLVLALFQSFVPLWKPAQEVKQEEVSCSFVFLRTGPGLLALWLI